jgi:hypothetical protein
MKVAPSLGNPLIISGCSSPHKSFVVSEAPKAKPGPFTTIVFHASKNGSVKYIDPGVATTEIVSPPTITANSDTESLIAKRQSMARTAGDEFLLIIRQPTGVKSKSYIYTITTDRTIVAGMNGTELTSPDQHELTVILPASTSSIIVIADSQEDATPYIASSVTMNHSLLDLNTGSNTPEASQADIRVDTFGGLYSANKATFAKWKSPLNPNLTTCESLPQSSWTTSLVSDYANLNNGIEQYFGGQPSLGVWCAHTNQGRYGYVNVLPNSGPWQLSFVIWRKPNDPVP